MDGGVNNCGFNRKELEAKKEVRLDGSCSVGHFFHVAVVVKLGTAMETDTANMPFCYFQKPDICMQKYLMISSHPPTLTMLVR